MRFLGVLLALAFVVTGLVPTAAEAQTQNQLELSKTFNVTARQVDDYWMKVDYDPRDSRRGKPGNELPPGLDSPVETVTVDEPATAVDPGNEMLVKTRKAGDFQLDVKQSRSKTTGGLPPGIERDTDASGVAASEGLDLLGVDRRVRSKADDEPKKQVLRPVLDRVGPAAMGADRAPRSTPRENAVRGVRGYKANRWE